MYVFGVAISFISRLDCIAPRVRFVRFVRFVLCVPCARVCARVSRACPVCVPAPPVSFYRYLVPDTSKKRCDIISFLGTT